MQTLFPDRRAVMGVVNVTPDSFSDGGRYLDVDAAVTHGERLAEFGADVLDVGGESTRPGATPVTADEERRRVVPVIERLAATGVTVSIDTTKAEVARAALDAGARIVNDVSAGRFDESMFTAVADRKAGCVVMHMRGEPRTMQDSPHYDDVVADVGRFLTERLDAARAAGIADTHLMADPGIGFGKTGEHNLSLLAHLDRLASDISAPLLVGASRKSFIGAVLGTAVDEREEGTLATTIWAFEQGAAMVRVHDVERAVRARALLDVMNRATPDGVRPPAPEGAAA